MKPKMDLFLGVLLAGILLAPQALTQQPAPARKASAPAFVPLPRDIQCSLQGLSYTPAVGAANEAAEGNGAVEHVTCWIAAKTPVQKKDLPLASNTITRGVVLTRNFGRLRIAPTNGGTSSGVAIAIRSNQLPSLKAFLQSTAQAAASAAVADKTSMQREVARLQPVIKPPATYSETKLAAIRPSGDGGFSPYWVAYIVSPDKDSADKSYYVELNGNRLGPYVNVSPWVRISPDQQHIAFAAQKGDLWTLVLDGVEKYSARKLLWAGASWSPALESNVFSNEVNAAIFDFVPGGGLVYPASGDDGLDHIFVNGVPGPGFGGFASQFEWINGAVFATGFTNQKPTVVHGTKQFGPYDSVSYEQVSGDRQHFAQRVTVQGVSQILYDDTLIQPKGEIGSFVIGPHGELAYSYAEGGVNRIVFNGQELPGTYQFVNYLAISPDGKKLAFWARKDGQWMLVAGDKTYPSARGYFIYIAGDQYAVMWSHDSQHVLYFVRNGKNGGIATLDGSALKNHYAPVGFMVMGIIQDDDGEISGEQMMGSGGIDQQGAVEAALQEGRTSCLPESSVLIGQTLSCIVRPSSNDSGNTAKSQQPEHVIYGDKEEGPYKKVASTLSATKDGKHYAYVVQSDQGWQVVVDGALRSQVFDQIYRAYLNDDDNTYEFLAARGGNLYHVVQPLAAQ